MVNGVSVSWTKGYHNSIFNIRKFFVVVDSHYQFIVLMAWIQLCSEVSIYTNLLIKNQHGYSLCEYVIIMIKLRLKTSNENTAPNVKPE